MHIYIYIYIYIYTYLCDIFLSYNLTPTTLVIIFILLIYFCATSVLLTVGTESKQSYVR